MAPVNHIFILQSGEIVASRKRHQITSHLHGLRGNVWEYNDVVTDVISLVDSCTLQTPLN